MFFNNKLIYFCFYVHKILMFVEVCHNMLEKCLLSKWNYDEYKQKFNTTKINKFIVAKISAF